MDYNSQVIELFRRNNKPNRTGFRRPRIEKDLGEVNQAFRLWMEEDPQHGLWLLKQGGKLQFDSLKRRANYKKELRKISKGFVNKLEEAEDLTTDEELRYAEGLLERGIFTARGGKQAKLRGTLVGFSRSEERISAIIEIYKNGGIRTPGWKLVAQVPEVKSLASAAIETIERWDDALFLKPMLSVAKLEYKDADDHFSACCEAAFDWLRTNEAKLTSMIGKFDGFGNFWSHADPKLLVADEGKEKKVPEPFLDCPRKWRFSPNFDTMDIDALKSNAAVLKLVDQYEKLQRKYASAFHADRILDVDVAEEQNITAEFVSDIQSYIYKSSKKGHQTPQSRLDEVGKRQKDGLMDLFTEEAANIVACCYRTPKSKPALRNEKVFKTEGLTALKQRVREIINYQAVMQEKASNYVIHRLLQDGVEFEDVIREGHEEKKERKLTKEEKKTEAVAPKGGALKNLYEAVKEDTKTRKVSVKEDRKETKNDAKKEESSKSMTIPFTKTVESKAEEPKKTEKKVDADKAPKKEETNKKQKKAAAKAATKETKSKTTEKQPDKVTALLNQQKPVQEREESEDEEDTEEQAARIAKAKAERERRSSNRS
jgi:hypothetical protein